MTQLTTRGANLPPRIKADPTELAGLEAALVDERAWYPVDLPRYQTADDLDVAEAQGVLRPVPVVGNKLFIPVKRFLEGRNPDDSRAVLRPEAIAGALYLAARWRVEMGDAYDPRIRLPMTSMTRAQTSQNDIVQDGGLGTPTSSHSLGVAWDFDASGYYILDGADVIPIVDPKRPQRAADQARYERYRRDYGPYDRAVTDALVRAADYMHNAGIIRRLVESANHLDGSSRTIHAVVNPDLRLAS